jgi:TonB-dependent receptor
MQMMMPVLPRVRALFAFLAAHMWVGSVSVQAAVSAGVGSIEGRVQDVTRGDYLNNARVNIAGTALTALTNEFGEFRIANVPAGEVTVTAFYSGLPAQTATVSVTAGSRVVKDFELRSAPTPGDVVQLAAVTVSTSREMSQAAIATNEQRFAPNMKTVLAADTFGEQSENNVAEFLKLMPAVTIDYVEQDARNASLRGMPAHATIVTSNGNQLASAASGTASRVFEFEQVSINEIARVEVNKSLMPDMPAEGIGGTINLITKSAFERSRPELRYRGYLNFNTTAIDFKETPGPFREPTYKIKPGFDFTYINPITKNFGFTLSGASSSKYNPQYFADRTWTLNADPVTRVESPYLSQILMLDAPKSTDRISGRIGLDWRIAARDVLSVGFSEQYYRALIGNRRWLVQVGTTPAAFSPEFVQGRAGAGTAGFTNSMNDKSGTTWTPEFKYTHNGSIWRFEAGGAYSHADNDYRASEKGFFSGVGTIAAGTVSAAGNAIVSPSVRFDYNGNYLPKVTTVLANGQTVDAQDASHMFLGSATALTRKSSDVKKTLRLNVARRVDFGLPLMVKAGGDYRESIRDLRDVTPTFTFLGPDGIANSADNRLSNYDLIDERYSTVPAPFGLPNFRWFSPWKIYDMYVAHPTWWTTNPATTHTNLVANSRYIDEKVSSGFVRIDTSLFRNRLLLSGGWRYQKYDIDAQTGEVDTLNQYLQDEDGNVVFDSATGQPIRLPGNALEITEKTNVERGIVRKSSVNGFYPSVNAIYRITDDLQFRTSFANSINYPQLSEIAAITTVSDLSANPRRLTVNKPLKPWTAHNYDVELQYFTSSGGSISVSAFRKQVTNFISTATYRVGTDAAREALERNGYAVLIPLNFEVVEKYNNANTARIDGWEFALNHSVDPFAPEWARGANVFFNHSYRGPPRGRGFSGLNSESSRVLNWGVNYRRARFAATLKWNHVPEPKLLSPSTTHNRSRTYTDADVSFRILRNLSIFASGTNIMGVPVENFVYTENTPDYARRLQHHFFGVQCVAGIKGQF